MQSIHNNQKWKIKGNSTSPVLLVYLNSHEAKFLNNEYSGVRIYCHSYSKSMVFFKQLEHVSASSAEVLRVPGPNPIMSQSSGLGSGLGAGIWGMRLWRSSQVLLRLLSWDCTHPTDILCSNIPRAGFCWSLCTFCSECFIQNSLFDCHVNSGIPVLFKWRNWVLRK